MVWVDYDCPREVSSAANLALPASVVDLIRLATWIVSAFTDRSAVYPRSGVFQATLATHNERVCILEPQAPPKDAKSR